ncbi:DUF2322 family protein [Tropicibacter naphthalenivorans]|uniref:DUF2322 domain-containing protein n=1 Tax=Tropicibacter naphthalenivorans TaxID=441103 RepID=A0A0P1GJP8_9RHOB|nr:DUF2322 family protein [Tropicibacter naphthalenivorans]CUH82162.1 hypothetical protein TRN7648_03838 [Tropicibacter naphthalenivorans]SMD05049.1 hypothetical protein SAMN04488093_11266 [Tropicibacter naphthalenivorans]
MTQPAMIQPTASFKENLQALPPIEGIERLELVNAAGEVVDTIENQPGKQGSLSVYQYLLAIFGSLTAEAATHGLAVFAEHTEDAQNRPGAHPNIDRLFDIQGGAAPLTLRVVKG